MSGYFLQVRGQQKTSQRGFEASFFMTANGLQRLS